MINTHIKPDLDAIASVWWHVRFTMGMSLAQFLENIRSLVKFVPAYWKGPVPEGDIALDLSVGIKGKKVQEGTETKVMSCFATLLEESGTDLEKKLLKPISEFVDAQDSTGDGLREILKWCDLRGEVPAEVRMTGIVAVLRSVERWANGDDYATLGQMAMILDGIYENARDFEEAKCLAAGCYVNGKVAFNPYGFAVSSVLYDQGIQLVVWTDKYNLGVTRHKDSKIRVGDVLCPIVEKLAPGEADEWFFHEAQFMGARGTQKAPMNTPSAINPGQLVDELAKVIQ